MSQTIAVIGQGYVGLPLSLEFASKFPVYGFDINEQRIAELKNAHDHTLEAEADNIKEKLEIASHTGFKKGYKPTASIDVISVATIYIVTVPTPIDRFNAPDLSYLLNACRMLGSILKKDDLVIFESTVYPGCTEEDCVPVLEEISGLRLNVDFFVGYSPERIVPGDKVNTLTTIVKVTSGSNAEVAEKVDKLYKTIIKAGTFKAKNIKVAEASKAIENAQRDLNISFVNELALIFDRLGIDTNDVLDAAATKFNFLKFKPGLVGGHCISVDPYYLAHKAEQSGYYPQVILSGRRVNDMMAEFIAGKIVKMMIQKGIPIKTSKALILGVTFKENCPDIRNAKVLDIYNELEQFGLSIDVYDPLADPQEVQQKFGIELVNQLNFTHEYAVIIVAVAHEQFKSLPFELLKKKTAVIFDVKALLNRDMVDARL